MTFERIDDADERDLGWPDVAGLLVLVLAFVAVLVWG